MHCNEATAIGMDEDADTTVENSPWGQYQLTVVQDAATYTSEVAPEKDSLVHTEDQAEKGSELFY